MHYTVELMNAEDFVARVDEDCRQERLKNEKIKTNIPMSTPDSAEAVNVRIHEIVGWFPCPDGRFWTRIPSGTHGPASVLPNYSGSLDAMHEAVATLGEHMLEEYACTLCQIVTGWNARPWKYGECDVASILKATPAQQAQAFLKISNH